MAKKYIVVVRGRKPGVYLGWDVAKEYVKNFNGPTWRGFDTVQECKECMLEFGMNPGRYLANIAGPSSASIVQSRQLQPRVVRTQSTSEVIFARKKDMGLVKGTIAWSQATVDMLDQYIEEICFPDISEDKTPLVHGGARWKLNGYQNLCRKIGKTPGPTISACISTIKDEGPWVNIFNFVDHILGIDKLRTFYSWYELKDYTMERNKWRTIPLEQAKQSKYLVSFLQDFTEPPLRPFLSPPSSSSAASCTAPRPKVPLAHSTKERTPLQPQPNSSTTTHPRPTTITPMQGNTHKETEIRRAQSANARADVEQEEYRILKRSCPSPVEDRAVKSARSRSTGNTGLDYALAMGMSTQSHSRATINHQAKPDVEMLDLTTDNWRDPGNPSKATIVPAMVDHNVLPLAKVADPRGRDDTRMLVEDRKVLPSTQVDGELDSGYSSNPASPEAPIEPSTGSIELDESSLVSRDGNLDRVAVQPLKRGRGRPRKHPISHADGHTNDPQTPALGQERNAASPLSTEPIVQPPKRGRGRPRKLPVVAAVEDSNPTPAHQLKHQPHIHTPLISSAVAKSSWRGRRPARADTAMKASRSVDTPSRRRTRDERSEDEDDEQQQPAKKLGRPPKNILSKAKVVRGPLDYFFTSK